MVLFYLLLCAFAHTLFPINKVIIFYTGNIWHGVYVQSNQNYYKNIFQEGKVNICVVSCSDLIRFLVQFVFMYVQRARCS